MQRVKQDEEALTIMITDISLEDKDTFIGVGHEALTIMITDISLEVKDTFIDVGHEAALATEQIILYNFTYCPLHYFYICLVSSSSTSTCCKQIVMFVDMSILIITLLVINDRNQ